jgi:hypothetical protein
MARDLAMLSLGFVFAHAWFGPGFQAGWQGVASRLPVQIGMFANNLAKKSEKAR